MAVEQAVPRVGGARRRRAAMPVPYLEMRRGRWPWRPQGGPRASSRSCVSMITGPAAPERSPDGSVHVQVAVDRDAARGRGQVERRAAIGATSVFQHGCVAAQTSSARRPWASAMTRSSVVPQARLDGAPAPAAGLDLDVGSPESTYVPVHLEPPRTTVGRPGIAHQVRGVEVDGLVREVTVAVNLEHADAVAAMLGRIPRRRARERRTCGRCTGLQAGASPSGLDQVDAASCRTRSRTEALRTGTVDPGRVVHQVDPLHDRGVRLAPSRAFSCAMSAVSSVIAASSTQSLLAVAPQQPGVVGDAHRQPRSAPSDAASRRTARSPSPPADPSASAEK